MGHEFESGILLREPAWHRLGNVLEDWPGSQALARKAGGLEWDIDIVPMATYAVTPQGLRIAGVNGWQGLVRDDKPLTVEKDTGLEVNPEALLSVQPSTYKVIRNGEFMDVVEYVVGSVGDDWQYETLVNLYGGRIIVALLKARTPLQIDGDPSKSYTYLGFTSRHDGQGGLRIIPTNVRILCANTHNAAENQARSEGVGFTIRHTANWEERKTLAAQAIQSSMKDSKAWEKLANRLIGKKLVPAQLDRMLLTLFKTDSSMVPQTVNRLQRNREEFRTVLGSQTCAEISDTMYGFVQAADEWVDHVKPAHNDETRFSRTLFRVDTVKSKALQLALAASSL